MKNLLTIITLAAITLASCTSTKNSMVMKRKYNKGYYVASNHKNKNTEVGSVEKTGIKEVFVSKTAPLTIEKIKPNTASFELINTSSDLKSTEIKSVPKMIEIKHNTIIADSKISIASSERAKIKTTQKIMDIVKNAKSKGGSDTDLIILVILCLFPILALIAVYLKDGKQITINFWITLLLHFIFLYWLFALLVVLDIIDLS